MDIVFYIEIGGSFGERTHALSFARRLEQAGYRPRFVVSPRVAEHVELAGLEADVFTSPEMGARLVREFDPAMVVGCELFNLSPVSVQGLMEVGCPIGTTDGTTLSLEINTNPFRFPELTRSLDLPQRYYSFRPCPVSDIRPDSDLVHHYSLFPDASRIEKDEAIYASLGLDPALKTVMFAVAPWAMKGARLLQMQSYYNRFLMRIVDSLKSLGEATQLLMISAGGRGRTLQGTVALHSADLISHDAYDHILSSCDAIVSDNIIQTSVSKAVMMGTPHLVIQNTTPSEISFPYNIFPLKLLFPETRDYAQIVDVAEFGDVRGVQDAIVAMLRGETLDPERMERRRGYLERVQDLADPAEIVNKILRPEDRET